METLNSNTLSSVSVAAATDKPPNNHHDMSTIQPPLSMLNSDHPLALKEVLGQRQVPRSSSPSTRSITSNTTNASSRYFVNRFTGKNPISENPELVELCHEFLKTRNVTGLAMIARQCGLPPNLRCKIWPILLKSHPHVMNPYIEIDDSSLDENFYNQEDENGDYKIPIKDIKFDLKKYLRTSERYKPKVITSELKDLYEIQDRMFDIIEHAIVKFLKKWGSILHYHPSLTWMALGLAEWVPPIQDSHFVLCGRDDIAKNGTKLRNVNESYFERLNYSSSSMTSESNSIFETPSDYLSPQFSTPTSSPPSTPPLGFNTMSFAELFERLVLVILHTPDPNTIPDELKPDDETTDQMKYSTLVRFGGPIKDRISFFLHSLRKLMPELHRHLSEEGCLNGHWVNWWLKYDGSKMWSRYDRGRTWDLIFGWRENCNGFESDLNKLNKNFDLSTLKLLGQDLFWNPIDLTDPSNIDHFDKSVGMTTTNVKDHNENNKLTGDVFENDDEEISEDENITHVYKNGRSASVLTILSRTHSFSQSSEKTPTLTSSTLTSPPFLATLANSHFQLKSPETNFSLTPTITIKSNDTTTNPLSLSSSNGNDTPRLTPLDDIEPLIDFPFSHVHPHVEMIFISLAFLKSKEFTIMELDNSEINTLLEKLTSLSRSERSSFINSSIDQQNYNNIKSMSSTSISPPPHVPANNIHQPHCLTSNPVTATVENTLNDEGHLNSMNDIDLTAQKNGMESAIGEAKKSNRDIENVLIEAGELWRKFLYIDMMDEA